MSVLKEIGVGLVILIPAVILLVLAWAFLSYPAEYVLRGLRWRDADVCGYYKYMWWGLQRGDGEHDISALGNKGQFIYVSPQNDLVVVRNAERYGPEALEWSDIFYEFASELEGEAIG